jgi:hypothetical protein
MVGTPSPVRRTGPEANGNVNPEAAERLMPYNFESKISEIYAYLVIRSATFLDGGEVMSRSR